MNFDFQLLPLLVFVKTLNLLSLFIAFIDTSEFDNLDDIFTGLKIVSVTGVE